MPEDSPYKSPEIESTNKLRGRLHWWFLSGFVPAFLWQLVFGNYTFYRITDHVVVGSKLWAFYYRKARLHLGLANAQESKGLLGSSFLEAILEHLVYAAIAGLIAVGISLLVRFVRRRSLQK